MRRFFSTRTELDAVLNCLRNQEKYQDSRQVAKALNLCNKLGCFQEGKWLHDVIIDRGLPVETYVGNTLISMYSKAGAVEEAAKVFQSMKQQRNVVTWTVLIAAYAQNGYYREAFLFFRRMRLEGLALDACAFRVLLTICANAAAVEEGAILHAALRTLNLETDLMFGNLLVNFYGKCGRVDEASSIFERMEIRNIVSWTSMVAANASNGYFIEALKLFREMQLDGSIRPNEVTFLVVLDACGTLEEVESLHAQVQEAGFEKDMLLATNLVDLFGKLNAPNKARQVFEKIPLPHRTSVSCTTMIAAYARSAHFEPAIQIYQQMQLEGMKPSVITFVTLMGACSTSRSLNFIEDHIVESGFAAVTFAGNALVNMYTKCEMLTQARQAFERIHEKDIVSWNSILLAYAQAGESAEAVRLIRRLRLEGFKLDEFTFIAGLTACATGELLAEGRLLHKQMAESGYNNDAMWASLVCMYRRCGELAIAQDLFNKMHRWNLSLWNTMITSCVQNGDCKQALQLFKRMKLEGVKPDTITYSSILDACGKAADLAQGKQIHAEMNEFAACGEIGVGSALLDMYAKCGSFGEAEKVFKRMAKRNIIAWTAMMAMFAQRGYSQWCLKLFSSMQQDGVRPNAVTFTVLLFACSHAGLLDEGREWFAKMQSEYGISSRRDHYTCMVDLLGRAGLVGDAEEMMMILRRMKRKQDLEQEKQDDDQGANWMSLLSSCRNAGEVETGKRAASNVLQQLKPDGNHSRSGAYVVLSQICTTV